MLSLPLQVKPMSYFPRLRSIHTWLGDFYDTTDTPKTVFVVFRSGLVTTLSPYEMEDRVRNSVIFHTRDLTLLMDVTLLEN
jgi:hypothetical protein